MACPKVRGNPRRVRHGDGEDQRPWPSTCWREGTCHRWPVVALAGTVAWGISSGAACSAGGKGARCGARVRLDYVIRMVQPTSAAKTPDNSGSRRTIAALPNRAGEFPPAVLGNLVNGRSVRAVSHDAATRQVIASPQDPGHQRDDAPMKLISGRRAHDDARPRWRPIPAWLWMLAAVAAVVIATFVVTMWLLAIASHAKSGTDLVNARLDAVRTGLAAGAGAGAAVGLILAFRRQHHQEIATVLTDLDATERRITELYTKAVEQLGSDKAPVRLGGLYALERLAQDNPAHRQTIVNVICAYLRMPFPPTTPTSKSKPEANEVPAAKTETSTSGSATHGRRKDRYVLPRSMFSSSICAATGPKLSTLPILSMHAFGLTSTSISPVPP